MAIAHFDIDNSEWTAITTAGQSGACWLLNPVSGGGNCKIFHGATPDNDDIPYGRNVYISTDNNDSLTLTADDTNDVFYARVDSVNGSCTLLVDVK